MTAAVSVNPATGEELARYPFADGGESDRLLKAASAGQREWAGAGVPTRAGVLARMAVELRAAADSLAELITAEMGKPITQARAEVAKSAATLDWYAEHGPAMLADEPTAVGPDVIVVYEPLGTVLAIQPWNFPVWQVIRGASTILLGGNGYLLKPAPTTVGCARALAELWSRAGLPAGAFTVLNADLPLVAEAIARDEVAAVTLTGSVAAGAAVAALAGRAVKKTVLELGGSDPFVVLADADLERAVRAAVEARFANSGQVCLAAKRLIVERSIAAEFADRLVAAVEALVTGDPGDATTFVGPLARADLREEIAAQVRRAGEQGARALIGGRAPDRPGYFYEPTVLAGVTPGTVAFDQELFGPVAAVSIADDVEDAIRLANRSEFGLSASIWSADLDRARRLARRLDVGGVFVNRIPGSDPRVPIGGVKRSGYGRELSHHGVREFLNAKTVWVEA